MVRKLLSRIMFAGLIMGLVIFTCGTNAFAVVACGWQLQYNPDPDPNANQLRAVWGPSATRYLLWATTAPYCIQQTMAAPGAQ